MRKLHFYDGVLPTFTVSGCERCCGRVPREDIIFVNQTEAPADRPSGRYCKVVLTVPRQQELGIMPQQNIAEYLMAIAALVQSAESNFADWYEKNPELMIKLTTLYCQDKVEEEA
jgi:sulfite reductase beta subunit-like hemoprotein